MNSGSIVQVSLKANEELIKRTKQTQTRAFHMIGKESYKDIAPEGKKKDWQMQGIDGIDALLAMSSREGAVVKLIKDNTRWDKQLNGFIYAVELAPESVHFQTDLVGSMDYNSFLKGYNALFKKDLVRRVRRNTYMFNPEFFLLSGETQTYFQMLWADAPAYKDKQAKAERTTLDGMP
jgi:hypothetical protein